MRAKSSLVLIVFSVALLGLSTMVRAQGYRATVQGLVTDSTQAVIPGAEVTLTNKDTGVSTMKVTNSEGRYLFDFVEPGTYTLKVELPGFKTFVQENILVQVRSDITVNATMAVGEVQETITVTTKPVTVQFNTSTMDLTVDRKMLTELPVVARNPFTLALLDAAVVNRYGGGLTGTVNARNPFFMWSSSSIDVGGGTSRKNDLQLDGAPLQLGWKGSYAPPMDAVQEFTIQQNSVDAEFGHSAGGVLSVGMKAGTNDYHGTAYYFGRNPALNAVTNAVVREPNEVRNHIWGGTLGNPIFKDRLFTFTSYEQWRNKAPYQTIMTLPTELERKGDYSQSRNAAGKLRVIYDPWTTKFDPSTGKVTRQPFPNNTIPDNRIDPVARRMLQDIWLPNGPGDDITGVNNYKKAYFWFLNYWNFSNRTDWNITDKWKVFGRYSIFRTDLDQPNYTPNNSIAMTNDNGGVMNSLNIAGDTVYVINATTALNFRFSYSSLNDDYEAPRSKIGEAGLAKLWPNPWYQSYIGDIPAIYYPGLRITGVGSASFGKSSWWWQHPESYNYAARFSKTSGAHHWKFGMESRLHRSNAVRPRFMDFRFGPALTADTFISPNTKLSGDGWATFLLGALNSDSSVSTVPRQKPMFDFYGLFFQDDFKLTRNLTLNLGLRWEYQTGPGDPENRLSRFLDLTQPIPEMQKNPPKIPDSVTALMDRPYVFNGAWVFTDDTHRRSWESPQNSFMPRLGFALRVDDRTAVRVGYARFIVPPIYATDVLGSMLYPGFDATTTVAPALEGIPAARLSDPFPVDSNPLIPPVGKTLGRYTNLGGGARWDQQQLRPAINDRINFSIQRQLPSEFHVDLTYFINLGHDLPYAKRLNLINPQLLYTHKAALDRRIPNPFFNYLTPQLFPGQLRNQRTIAVRDLLRPYPHYGALEQTNTAGLENRYHALQLMVKRPFSSGYLVHFAYNYNREKTYNDKFFNDIDEFEGRFTYLDSENPRHRIAAANIYDLPVGRGRAFLSEAHPIVDGILGGWTVSSLFLWTSGEFLRFGPMLAEGDPRLKDPTRDRWFDTSKFERLPAFTPRTNPWQYEGLTGPKQWQIDVSVAKLFQMTERMRLEFRMEAYNLTNSFVPGNPDTRVLSSLFGKSTTQANRGRELQYTARIHF